MTQTQRILKHMTEHGSITPKDALDLFGCMRLGARIYDLKKAGYNIVKEDEYGLNRLGEKTKYARYKLQEAGR